MEITREKHLAYITRLMPLLLLAYVLQIYVYMRWAPRDMAIDVSVFVGIGLILVAMSFAFYDLFYKVRLHRHHLEFGIKWLRLGDEVLYRHIQSYEIEVTKHAFYNVTLYLRDGREVTLYYLDDVQELKHCIKTCD